MKNKGFTLIELLAVLVILAIIALIAVPIIQSIIKDSKKSAAIRSAELYIDAIDQTIASNDFDIEDGTYNIDENGNLCLDDACSETLTIKVEKSIPITGSVQIEDARVVSVSNLYFEKQKFYISESDGQFDASKSKIKIYETGEIVYFDIQSGKKCTNYHSDNSKDGYNGLSSTKTTNNQNSCLKFNAFLDDGSNNVNLLLDHNTSTSVSNNIDSNMRGPETAIQKLKEDTKDWNGVKTPKNYTYHSKAGTHKYKNDESIVVPYDAINYIIDYTGYKARLITANEVAKIANVSTFDETTNDGTSVNENAVLYPNFSLEIALKSITSSSEHREHWILPKIGYDYITSSAVHDTYGSFWTVVRNGELQIGVNKESGQLIVYGIRPVIEVLKDNLN